MEECKLVGIPFDAISKLFKVLGEEFENVAGDLKGVPHKVGVGPLMYAMLAMRVDIAIVMSTLS